MPLILRRVLPMDPKEQEMDFLRERKMKVLEERRQEWKKEKRKKEK